MDTTKFDTEVKSWMKDATLSLKSKAKDLGIEHRENSPSATSSVEALKAAATKKFGVTNKVSFKFPRHMVFVHKGVGKGTSIAQAGSTTRKAKEWFEPVLDEKIEDLADIAAAEIGDTIVANFKL